MLVTIRGSLFGQLVFLDILHEAERLAAWTTSHLLLGLRRPHSSFAVLSGGVGRGNAGIRWWLLRVSGAPILTPHVLLMALIGDSRGADSTRLFGDLCSGATILGCRPSERMPPLPRMRRISAVAHT
jgi:hypothetical protein